MPGHPVAVLTGPNLAKEILSGQPAASVVAINDDTIAGELQRIFSRPVDLVSRRAVERSRNPYRKQSILARTEPIYVEG